MITHPLRALVAGIAASALISTASAAQQTATDSITAFHKGLSEATTGEGFARLFAPTARVMPPGAPAVVGRDSIRAWFERTRDATRQIGTWFPEETTVAGHFAVVITTFRGTRAPGGGAGGMQVPVEARYIDILERTPAGWVVASRSWTETSSPPSGTPPAVPPPEGA